MKKKLSILILCLIIVLITGFAYVKNDYANSITEDSSTIKVGITMYNEYDPFTEEIRHNIEDNLALYGEQFQIQVTTQVVYSGENQLVQNDQVTEFIEKDFDIICVNLVDRTDPSVIIEKAKSSNTPIIFFNRELVEDDLKRFNELYYVGARPEESGKIQGQIVLDALNQDFSQIDTNGDGIIQYVLLEGEAGHQDAIIRSRVSVETLLDAGIEMEMLGDEIANWDRQQAQTKMSSLLAGYPRQIELVLANDDNMALGALDALTDYGVNPLPFIVGVNGQEEVLKAISQGTIQGTALNNAEEKGRVIAQLVFNLITESDELEDIQLENGKYYYVSYEEINRDNVTMYMK